VRTLTHAMERARGTFPPGDKAPESRRFVDFHSARAQLKLAADNADRTSMNLSAIALQGLHQAGARLESAGSKIASLAASSPGAANQDTVDLSAAVVALLSAKNLYSANLRTVKTADEILKTSIDLIA
jgi:flagellar hook protein FlgE